MASFINPSGGTKRSRRAFAPMTDINVTPMVDVMLVLLVIFIVTAPLLTTGVNVKLPQTNKAKSLSQDNKALTLYIERDGGLTLNDTKVDVDSLQARLSAMVSANPNLRVYVKGDKDVAYGLVMQVMAAVTSAGITQAAFVTEPQHAAPRTPQ